MTEDKTPADICGGLSAFRNIGHRRKESKMAMKGNDTKIRCSFCGKTDDQVKKLIAGPNGTYICDECVGICAEIIDEELGADFESQMSDEINLHKPQEIKEFLDEAIKEINNQNMDKEI